MKTSDNLDKLAADLTLAQAEMGGAVKDSTNPFFNAKYSSLTSVWKACKDALHKYGFSVIQSPIDVDGRIGVETMLLHKSGQFIRDRYTLGVKKQNDPQADGSSISYSRRYALAAFVGICPEDDDAEKSMARNQPQKTYTAPKNSPNQAMNGKAETGPRTDEQFNKILEIGKKNNLSKADVGNMVKHHTNGAALMYAGAEYIINNFDAVADAYVLFTAGQPEV